MKRIARRHTFIITLLCSLASFTVHAESQPSSNKAGDEKTATIEQNTQASNSPTMTQSEIEERIKELDAKGSEMTMDDKREKAGLQNQLIAIEKAETAEKAKTIQRLLEMMSTIETISIEATK